ncbi:Alpha/Beta hydrolase protein [Aspergillus floccosus]
METRLSQMKARHRHVLEEISQLDNSVESKLSSYKASLSLLESKIQRFLQSPPVEPYPVNPEQTVFYSLNPKRRTLDMAKEYWDTEQSDLQRRQEEITAEIQALEEGGGVWKQVVGEVSGFEKRLRATMRRSIERQSQVLNPDESPDNQAAAGEVQSILEDLTHTTTCVEHHLEIAEAKDWRLLICCIAAELEALREARNLLLDAFGVTENEVFSSEKGEAPEGQRGDIQFDSLGVNNPEPPADLLRDADAHSQGAVSRSDEDDEPDPAWLLPEAGRFGQPGNPPFSIATADFQDLDTGFIVGDEMYLPAPTFAFTIPSVHDETRLDCRLYLPTGLMAEPSFSQPICGAIVAHPYASLGGCYDDPVVSFIGGELLENGYIVGTFNFRGASDSDGRTSWTARPEVADYVSFYGLMLTYLHMLAKSRSRSDDAPTSEHAESPTDVHLVLGGYSYGSLIASNLPAISVIADIFNESVDSTPVREIFLAAKDIYGLSYLISPNIASSAPCKQREIPCPKPIDRLCTCPTLVIYGDEDAFTSASKLRKWTEQLKKIWRLSRHVSVPASTMIDG